MNFINSLMSKNDLFRVRTPFLYTLLCFCLACLTIVGCNYAPSHGDYAQLWGTLGAGVFDTLKAPETVEYYKVTPAMPGQGPQTYQPAGKVQTLSNDDVSKLQKLVLNDNNYQFGLLKKCVFVPETAFRFKKGDKDALLLVSMTCKQVTFDLGEQRIRLDIDPSADNFTDFISHLPN